MDEVLKFNRRKLLVGGIATLAVPSLVAGSETSAPSASPFVRPDRELTTLTSKDSGFQAQVEALFPNLQNNPKFQMMAPLAVLIQHKSGPAVRAYSLSWNLTTQTGRPYQTTLYKYAQPGTKRRGRAGRSLASGQTDILRAGESRLATPFFTLSPSTYKAFPNKWEASVTPTEPGTYLASQLETATDVKVTMDAAIFGDHTVFGPDQSNLLRRFRARRNAEHDTAVQVLDLVNGGSSDSDIATALQAKGNGSRTTRKGATAWYVRSKRNYAQFLMKKFHAMDREQFTRILSVTASMRNNVLHRPKS